MAGELNIQDEGCMRELLELPAPLGFIDFEAFMPQNYIIPGTMTTDTVPCQWSCHVLDEHGLNWEGKLHHSEYLWTGDRGWSPIYSFAQSLYEATKDCKTILIYTGYEIRCLNMCKQLAQNDMDMYNAAINGSNAEQTEYWKNYVVVDANGNKVPLMSIAPKIAGWCDSMLERFYDQCYGRDRNGGVHYWLQSDEFDNSDSIKHVMPAAMKEYSRTAELLMSEGEPSNGYEGLRELGQIAKGDECTSRYLAALNREPRADIVPSEPGNAPFDESIIDQCLIYCRLDTLSMVVIYLAVLEASERWVTKARTNVGSFARFDDGLFHAVEFDADNRVFYKDCDVDHEHPYPYDSELEFVSEETLQNMPIREYYKSVCPECRRMMNNL